MKEINENIKKLRTERKVSQEQMADLLGITRSAYSKKEKAGEFSASDVLTLTSFFKVKPETIYSLNGPYVAVFNDAGKDKNAIEDLTPFTATNNEQELILALRKLPKSRLNEILENVKKEAEITE